jgi:cytochrome c-type biogenesis protein
VNARRLSAAVWSIALLAAVGAVVWAPAAVRAERAPDYAAAVLDGDGELSLADLRGEVVLLNGWATWCVPCREEMPYLETLHQRYGGEGLRIVGTSIDRGGADDRVRDFAANTGVTFTILRDPENRFQRTFRTTGVPESVLIGRDGEILFRWKGPLEENDPDDIALIEGALAGTVADAGDVTGRVARIGVPVAFAAGLLSFLSPCVFPLIPTYAAIISGMTMGELRDPSAAARRRARRATMTSGVLFVLGFTLVFIALGASATLLGEWLQDYRIWISRAGGVLLVVLALHLLGLLRLPFADRDVRVHLKKLPTGYVGTFAIGVAFGAGWTPCIGPALASILTLAAADASVAQGMGLLAVYSLGLAIPFLLATAALDRFTAGTSRLRRWLPRLQQASGVLILLIAALLLTDSLSRLNEYAGWSPLAFDPIPWVRDLQEIGR